MRPGWSGARAVYPKPRGSSAPGAQLSTRISHVRARRRTIAAPVGLWISRVMLFFPVFKYRNRALCSASGTSPTKGPRRRDTSPEPGGSTLMTSAPKPARSLVQKGPATSWLRSSTRMSSKMQSLVGIALSVSSQGVGSGCLLGLFYTVPDDCKAVLMTWRWSHFRPLLLQREYVIVRQSICRETFEGEYRARYGCVRGCCHET